MKWTRLPSGRSAIASTSRTGRFSRIEKKFSDYAEMISRDDPELAKALRTAFEQPARALAFKNAEHQKELKRQRSTEAEDDDT